MAVCACGVSWSGVTCPGCDAVLPPAVVGLPRPGSLADRLDRARAAAVPTESAPELAPQAAAELDQHIVLTFLAGRNAR